MTKYHNIITKVDGIKFDSKKEARRYQELKLLEKAGRIFDLILQPKFLLQDSYFWRDSKTNKIVKVRAIYYIADFQYLTRENNLRCKKSIIIVEDVKGKRTDVYELKKKMFLKLYGEGYIFREV